MRASELGQRMNRLGHGFDPTALTTELTEKRERERDKGKSKK